MELLCWTYEFNDESVAEILEPLENITVFGLYRKIDRLKRKWSSTKSKTKIMQERRVAHHHIWHDSAINFYT